VTTAFPPNLRLESRQRQPCLFAPPAPFTRQIWFIGSSRPQGSAKSCSFAVWKASSPTHACETDLSFLHLRIHASRTFPSTRILCRLPTNFLLTSARSQPALLPRLSLLEPRKESKRGTARQRLGIHSLASRPQIDCKRPPPRCRAVAIMQLLKSATCNNSPSSLTSVRQRGKLK
jgi:hypothetical protein